jgi:DNA-binding response OmpR family regulator
MALICVAGYVTSTRTRRFFSGAAYEADKKRGIEAGANAYVIKPDFDGLLGAIKQFVSRAESAAVQTRADREVNNTRPLTYEIARASHVG